MEQNRHYRLVANALRWLSEHQADQPRLDELAGEMQVSPHHLQRTFQAWAGVSPKQFLKSLTREAALERLSRGESVLDAALHSGLSGPGRLHDLMVTSEALTPGEIRKKGMGVDIQYGFGETPFGEALVAWTDRGINFLGFSGELGADRTLRDLQDRWNQANLVRNGSDAEAWLSRIFDCEHSHALPLWLRGSPFQLKVWEALLAIPEGSHASYGQLAALVGKPGASRAVGSAVGSNPVAWIIPCHRVIRQVGDLGSYHWGNVTKRAMIGFEAGRVSPAPGR
jgi:AraC family transcriptional regulator of adaptative response/methylated-DNA-[protein]-cysteine methyltransferase